MPLISFNLSKEFTEYKEYQEHYLTPIERDLKGQKKLCGLKIQLISTLEEVMLQSKQIKNVDSIKSMIQILYVHIISARTLMELREKIYTFVNENASIFRIFMARFWCSDPLLKKMIVFLSDQMREDKMIQQDLEEYKEVVSHFDKTLLLLHDHRLESFEWLSYEMLEIPHVKRVISAPKSRNTSSATLISEGSEEGDILSTSYSKDMPSTSEGEVDSNPEETSLQMNLQKRFQVGGRSQLFQSSAFPIRSERPSVPSPLSQSCP